MAQSLSRMSEVISNQQANLNRSLHESDESFGSRPDAGGLTSCLAPAIHLMHKAGVCNSVLDYGTGKGHLVHNLRENLPQSINITGYDPAVQKWLKKPAEPFDIVTCLDVLEHVEVESIDAVLSDIRFLSSSFCFLIIDLQPAIKRLADGRNAHILLAPCDWWIARISQHFNSISAFPLVHSIGVPQKLIVAASSNPAYTRYMYTFLSKMNLFKIKMAGGLLKG